MLAVDAQVMAAQYITGLLNLHLETHAMIVTPLVLFSRPRILGHDVVQLLSGKEVI
jgi:hypothetical protein